MAEDERQADAVEEERVVRLYERWRACTRQYQAAVAAGGAENVTMLAHQVRILRGALARLGHAPHELSAPGLASWRA
jgi:hypothetical protein